MAKKLFVGSLSWDTTDESLGQFFSQAGTVLSANVIKDKFTGKSRGFGFVEMETDEQAEAAKKLDGQSLDNRNITVNDAKPQEARESSYSQGDRRDNRGGDFRGGRSNFSSNKRRSY